MWNTLAIARAFFPFHAVLLYNSNYELITEDIDYFVDLSCVQNLRCSIHVCVTRTSFIYPRLIFLSMMEIRGVSVVRVTVLYIIIILAQKQKVDVFQSFVEKMRSMRRLFFCLVNMESSLWIVNITQFNL